MMLVGLCAVTMKLVFDVDKNRTAVEGMAYIMYIPYQVSRITGEKKAGC